MLGLQLAPDLLRAVVEAQHVIVVVVPVPGDRQLAARSAARPAWRISPRCSASERPAQFLPDAGRRAACAAESRRRRLSADSRRITSGWMPPSRQTDRLGMSPTPRTILLSAYWPAIVRLCSQKLRSFAAPRWPLYLSIEPKNPDSSSCTISTPFGTASERLLRRLDGRVFQPQALLYRLRLVLASRPFRAAPTAAIQTETFGAIRRRASPAARPLRAMIGDFFVLGIPTSVDPEPRAFAPSLRVLLHHQLDAVGDRGRAYRQRRHRDAAGIDAHRLSLLEGVVLDQLRQQTARQYRRFEDCPRDRQDRCQSWPERAGRYFAAALSTMRGISSQRSCHRSSCGALDAYHLRARRLTAAPSPMPDAISLRRARKGCHESSRPVGCSLSDTPVLDAPGPVS